MIGLGRNPPPHKPTHRREWIPITVGIPTVPKDWRCLPRVKAVIWPRQLSAHLNDPARALISAWGPTPAAFSVLVSDTSLHLSGFLIFVRSFWPQILLAQVLIRFPPQMLIRRDPIDYQLGCVINGPFPAVSPPPSRNGVGRGGLADCVYFARYVISYALLL